jgi:hypothetical protein
MRAVSGCEKGGGWWAAENIDDQKIEVAAKRLYVLTEDETY